MRSGSNEETSANEASIASALEKGLALGVWAAQAVSVQRLFVPADGLVDFDDDDLLERLTDLVCDCAGIAERGHVRH